MKKAFIFLLAGIVLVIASIAFFMAREELVAYILIVSGLLVECYAVIVVLRTYKRARKPR
ncbi:MAG TPA: hypothetical protein VL092_09590 [Chitinophagaceae bacterium]|nr:hypothetical protein [Chitinophagaceae bacterium]